MKKATPIEKDNKKYKNYKKMYSRNTNKIS